MCRVKRVTEKQLDSLFIVLSTVWNRLIYILQGYYCRAEVCITTAAWFAKRNERSKAKMKFRLAVESYVQHFTLSRDPKSLCDAVILAVDQSECPNCCIFAPYTVFLRGEWLLTFRLSSLIAILGILVWISNLNEVDLRHTLYSRRRMTLSLLCWRGQVLFPSCALIVWRWVTWIQFNQSIEICFYI